MKSPQKEWISMVSSAMEPGLLKEIASVVVDRYEQTTTYPPKGSLFRSFRYFDLRKLRVVILGQDPYHGYGQANGLSFSVNPGVISPPSLKNICREMKNDVGSSQPLGAYHAEQGVLLLNTALTVEENKPGSHSTIWEPFTAALLACIVERCMGTVWMLWGSHAQSFKPLISNRSHYVLSASHPSPFSASRSFFGCKHFSKCNKFLTSSGLASIDW